MEDSCATPACETGCLKQSERTRTRIPQVAIIGAGFVGSTTAYALLNSGMAAEIVLIDRNRRRAEGHVQDLRDPDLTSMSKCRSSRYRHSDGHSRVQGIPNRSWSTGSSVGSGACSRLDVTPSTASRQEIVLETSRAVLVIHRSSGKARAAEAYWGCDSAATPQAENTRPGSYAFSLGNEEL